MGLSFALLWPRRPLGPRCPPSIWGWTVLTFGPKGDMAMTGNWKPAKAADVRPGDRIRTADGSEVVATHIELAFFGRENMIAFIEDTPERWFKRPMTVDADVEALVSD